MAAPMNNLNSEIEFKQSLINSSICENYSEILDTNNPYKLAAVTISIFSIIFVTPAFYSLIWYERFGSDKKRTIINKLLSSISWNAIEWNLGTQTVFVARFIYGPLPTAACLWLYVLRKAIILQVFFFLDAILITRYVLIFWLQNPAAFQDEFWTLFINVWVKVISFLLPIVRAYVPGNQLLEFQICTGQDPSEILQLPPFARGFVDISSLILQIIIYIRITIYKREKLYYVGPETRHTFLKNEALSDLEKTSMRNISTNIFILSLVAMGVILASLGTFKSCQDFKAFPKYATIYYSYLIFPSSILFLSIGLYFGNNRHLRITIFRELRNSLGLR